MKPRAAIDPTNLPFANLDYGRALVARGKSLVEMTSCDEGGGFRSQEIDL